MANNFIGSVTRQEKNSGVTLRARVTSPRAKVSKYQDFRCMVKKAGLTDAQSVIAALKIIVDNLNSARVHVNNLSNSITSEMPNIGEYDTKVEYRIIGDDIKEYFSNTGKVIKRPAFNTNNIVGDLEITVSKNNEMVSQTITVGIAAYTADEIRELVVNSLDWDVIRGTGRDVDKNAEYDIDPFKNGQVNICKNLNLITKIEDDEKLTSPINITWAITDAYAEGTRNPEKRISANGTLLRPTYTEFNNKRIDVEYSSINNLFTVIDNNSDSIQGIGSGWFMRVGGLKLVASFELANADIIFDDITFDNLATLSQMLTSTEVADYLKTNFDLIKTWFSVTDATYNETFAPTAGSEVISNTPSRQLKYGTTGGSMLSFLANADAIRETTKSNRLIDGGFNIDFNPLASDGPVKIFDLTGATVTDLSKTITDAATDLASLSKGATSFSSGYSQSGNRVNLEITTNNSATDILFRCTYRISSYAGGDIPFVVGFKFSLAPA